MRGHALFVARRVHHRSLARAKQPDDDAGEAIAVHLVPEDVRQLGRILGWRHWERNPAAPEREFVEGRSSARRNHFGSKSRLGTEVAAILYSIVETAKVCGVDPAKYLNTAVASARRGTVLLPAALADSARISEAWVTLADPSRLRQTGRTSCYRSARHLPDDLERTRQR